METKYFEGEMSKVTPIVNQEGSDSAMLDNTLEFLMMSGLELPLAVMILMMLLLRLMIPWLMKCSLMMLSN